MGFNRYPSLPARTVSQTRKCQGCHSERSEESRPINRLHKSRSFGGVYPENIEGPQDDITKQLQGRVATPKRTLLTKRFERLELLERFEPRLD